MKYKHLKATVLLSCIAIGGALTLTACGKSTPVNEEGVTVVVEPSDENAVDITIDGNVISIPDAGNAEEVTDGEGSGEENTSNEITVEDTIPETESAVVHGFSAGTGSSESVSDGTGGAISTSTSEGVNINR